MTFSQALAGNAVPGAIPASKILQEISLFALEAVISRNTFQAALRATLA